MSYATPEYANAYHGARLTGPAWLAVDDQAAALQCASDLMDAYAMRNGGWLADYATTPPAALQDVCSSLALRLTDQAMAQRRELIAQGVKSTSMGGASESYADATQTDVLRSDDRLRLAPYLLGKQRVVTIR